MERPPRAHRETHIPIEREFSPEEELEIMEKAREMRLGMLAGVIDRWGEELKVRVPKPARTIISAVANYAGVFGAVKMVGEAARGKTVSGEELTPLGRINHLLIHGTNGLAYYSFVQGEFKRAGIAYATSWALNEVQYWPEILNSLEQLAEKRDLPKIKQGLGATNRFLNRVGIRKLFFKQEVPPSDSV